MKIKKFIFLLCVLTTFSVIKAQSTLPVEITDIKPSNIHPLKVDLYLYGEGTNQANNRLYTAENTMYDKRTIYLTQATLGLEAELYTRPWLRFNPAIAYTHGRYALSKGFGNTGINSSWLSLDLNVSAGGGFGLYYMAGVKNSLYLGSNHKAEKDYQYSGIPSDCFNHLSSAWYVGLSFRISYVKAYVKLGSYFTPFLNANKIAYYNLTTCNVPGFFIEFGAGINIFTNRSRYNLAEN